MAKVLLVEDDNNLREIFEMRLQAEGYQTVTAGDGEEALTVAMKEKPDLIIADVMMPRLSGFEMLETLRSAPDMAHVKVIMMTALGQAEDQARGERLGVVKYLVKSQVTLEDFVRVVREVLQPSQSAAGGNSPGTGTGPVTADKVSTNKESERSMQDDSNSSNPAPAGDSGAPAGDSSNPVSGAPMPSSDGSSMGGSAPMSSSDEQKMVDNQVDNAMGGAPAAPAGDGGMAPSSPPADDSSQPPAGGSAPAGSGM